MTVAVAMTLKKMYGRYVAATITQTSYVTMCSVFLGLMEYLSVISVPKRDRFFYRRAGRSDPVLRCWASPGFGQSGAERGWPQRRRSYPGRHLYSSCGQPQPIYSQSASRAAATRAGRVPAEV